MYGPLAQRRGVIMGPIGRGPMEPSPWASYFHDYDTTKPIVFQSTAVDQTPLTVRISLIEDQTALVSPPPTPSIEPLFVEVSRSGTTQTFTHSHVNFQSPFGIQTQAQTNPLPGPSATNAYLIGSHQRSNPTEIAGYFSSLKVEDREHDLLKALQIVDDHVRSAEVLVMNGQPSLYLHTDARRPLPLSLFGEGTTAIAEYVLVMHASRSGVLLIDEIDNDDVPLLVEVQRWPQRVQAAAA